jgi:tRNA-dihydrouridine synthase A
MLGRAACENPYLFAECDRRFYDANALVSTRQAIVEAMLPYVDEWVSQGHKLHSITRHMLHLYAGQPGSRIWKRHLTEEGRILGRGADVLLEALELVNDVQRSAEEHVAQFVTF